MKLFYVIRSFYKSLVIADIDFVCVVALDGLTHGFCFSCVHCLNRFQKKKNNSPIISWYYYSNILIWIWAKWNVNKIINAKIHELFLLVAHHYFEAVLTHPYRDIQCSAKTHTIIHMKYLLSDWICVIMDKKMFVIERKCEFLLDGQQWSLLNRFLKS